MIGRGAYVGTGVQIGDNVKLQNYALVYEPAELGDGVFVGPAAVLTNDHYPRSVDPEGNQKRGGDWEAVGVTVAEGASLGARSVCVAPVRIGRWAMVAAGAVVTKDVPDFGLVVGVPARRVGWVGRSGVKLVERTASRESGSARRRVPARRGGRRARGTHRQGGLSDGSRHVPPRPRARTLGANTLGGGHKPTESVGSDSSVTRAEPVRSRFLTRTWSFAVQTPRLSDTRLVGIARWATNRMAHVKNPVLAERVLGVASHRIQDSRTRADVLTEAAEARLGLGYPPRHLTQAYAAVLVCADEHHKAGRRKAAAASAAKALILAFHRVAHLDGTTSPLATDPARFTAPMRRSRTLRALRAPRGRSAPAAAPPEGRPLRLLFVHSGNDNFLPTVMDRYRQRPDTEVRVLNTAADPVTAPLAKGMGRMIACGLGSGREVTPTGRKRLCVRFSTGRTSCSSTGAPRWRSGDADRPTGRQGDCPAAQLRGVQPLAPPGRLLPRRRPGVRQRTPAGSGRCHAPPAAGAGRTGHACHRQRGRPHPLRPPEGARSTLHPRPRRRRPGRQGSPLGPGGAARPATEGRPLPAAPDRRPDEPGRRSCPRPLSRGVRRGVGPTGRGRGRDMSGHTDDVPAELTEVGLILSTSIRESWHLGLVEGAASGAVPVVRDWPFFADKPHGAHSLFPCDWVVSTPEEAAERILAVNDTEESWLKAGHEASEVAISSWDWGTVGPLYDQLLPVAESVGVPAQRTQRTPVE